MKNKNYINKLSSNESQIRLSPRITVLDNGITVITDEIPYLESFSLGIGISVGSRDDWNGKNGLAHFLEHSVYRRTENRTSRQIAIQLDSVGAYSNAYTTKELTLFYVRATKFHFNKCFDILADIILHPIFLKNEIEKERQIIIEEIKSYDDDPEEYIFDVADEVIFPNNPLGLSIDGTINSLNSITTDDLEAFHKQFYQPQNIVIAVSGNIPNDKVVDTVMMYFADKCNYGEKIKRDTPNPIIQNKIINKPIQQAHLIFGKQIFGANHPDKYTLSLLNIIFGDGLSSRLYQNLREKQGLAYSVFSQLNLFSDCGSVYHYIATDKSKIEKAEESIYKELIELKNNKVKKTEFSRAKEQYKTAKILEFESVSARMQNLIKNQIVSQKIETLHDIICSIDKITIDDIVRVIENYYNENNLSKILLLPKNNGK
ncbi:MAG: pitrilysin family protein [Bacteroidota bacterium]